MSDETKAEGQAEETIVFDPNDERYNRLMYAVHKLVYEIYKEFGREPKTLSIDDEFVLKAVKTHVTQRMYRYDINIKRNRETADFVKLRNTPEGRKAIEELLRKASKGDKK